MKKSLLSILALALVAVGCQNYDDQFDSLNADIAALTTKVNGLDAGVAAQVTAVAASVANLATQVTALGSSALTTTDLTTALSGVLSDIATVSAALTALDTSVATQIAGTNTSVAALQTTLTAVQTSALTAADVAALDEVSNLNAEMTAVQSALDELLAAQASVNANVTITNQAELDYVETLMETDGTPANYIINGSLTITANAAASYTTGTDYIAAISLLTSKIASVIGNVTITTTSSTAALDLTQLTYVSGDFKVAGAFDDAASKLSTANKVEVDINSDSFALPLLVSAATGLRLNDVTTGTVSPLTVDVVNLTTGAVTTADGILNFPSADVNLGAGSPAADTDVKSIIATGVAALASADIEATGDITIGALTVTGTVFDGANVTLSSGATGSTFGGGSTINATGNIVVNALTINGDASSMTNDGGSGGGITLGATSIQLLTAVTSGTGTIDASSAKETASGAMSLTAPDVILTALVTNTGTLTIVNDTNIQLPALKVSAGTITAAKATTFYAPLLTTDGAIDLEEGTASVDGADVTVKSLTVIADLADIATINKLTIAGQAASVSLDLSTAVKMESLAYVGVAGTGATQANNLTLGAGAVSLTTVDFTGNGGIGTLSITGTGLTSLSTVGRLRSLVVSGTGNGGATASGLDAITIGNVGISGGTAGVVSITQTGITSLDLSGWSWIKNINVTGNSSMTTMTFPSGIVSSTLPTPNVSTNVDVFDNAITGAITAPVDQTESNIFVESSLASVGFVGAKTWLNAIESQAANKLLTVSYSLEIDADDTDIQAVCDDSGADGVAATAIWNATSEIDITAELGLLAN